MIKLEYKIQNLGTILISKFFQVIVKFISKNVIIVIKFNSRINFKIYLNHC